MVRQPAGLADGAQDGLPIRGIGIERDDGSADHVAAAQAEDFLAPAIDRKDPVANETRHHKRDRTVVEQFPKQAGLGGVARNGLRCHFVPGVVSPISSGSNTFSTTLPLTTLT